MGIEIGEGMFFIMAKQKFLVAIMYSLCILYAGNVREVKQPADGQNQELRDAFVEKVE